MIGCNRKWKTIFHKHKNIWKNKKSITKTHMNPGGRAEPASKMHPVESLVGRRGAPHWHGTRRPARPCLESDWRGWGWRPLYLGAPLHTDSGVSIPSHHALQYIHVLYTHVSTFHQKKYGHKVVVFHFSNRFLC